MPTDRKLRFEPQDETNILGYLDGEARLLSCASEPTEIVLVSDGVENSTFVSGEEVISGTRGLPEPPADLLAGCAVTILGIGQLAQGATAPFTRQLIATWTEWAETAGITNFRALPRF